jgi:dihydrofolate reductase
MTEIVLLAALDRHGAIGKHGMLPWHLPDDLKGFKAYTMGKPMLMGRKTAHSLGHALPGRLNLVLTHAGAAPWPGMAAVASVEEALAIAAAGPANELCVIGGGEIYAAALPFATRLRLTHVDTVAADADTFFPQIDMSRWTAVSWDEHGADERHAFAFTVVNYLAVPAAGAAPELH